MDINTQEASIEAVTMSDILNLSTWDRTRTSDELISFISRREAALQDISKNQ